MKTSTRVAVGLTITFVGVAALGFAVFIGGASRAAETRAQDVLYAEFRKQLKAGTAAIGAPIEQGHPVAFLEIERIGLAAVVVESAASGSTQRGPGHVSTTPLPGQPGVSVILGRRATFGGPFRRLPELKSGDAIRVTTGQGTYTYVVDGTRRSDVDAKAPKVVASRLSLVTSDPAYVPTRSLVVTGALKGSEPAPATAHPVGSSPSEAALKGQPNVVIRLLLWSQALLAVAIGAALLWRRIPNTTLWVGAVPLLMLVAWNLSESLSALLPNTL
jgi:sortase A